jgi:hypothetical protein
MDEQLPSEITQGATIQGNEYGWSVSALPHALQKAPDLGYGCLGGQFQFRFKDATCEMYWLSADSNERRDNEAWLEYCRRSCSEVLSGFQNLVETVDFRKQGESWAQAADAFAEGVDPRSVLVFVAYFVDEAEQEGLARFRTK